MRGQTTEDDVMGLGLAMCSQLTWLLVERDMHRQMEGEEDEKDGERDRESSDPERATVAHRGGDTTADRAFCLILTANCIVF